MTKRLEDLQDAEYLGDGLYAGHDGFHVWLVAHDGYRTTNAVGLEPPVLKAFDEYRERLL